MKDKPSHLHLVDNRAKRDNDDTFSTASREVLNKSAESIDADTLARLQSIRQAAQQSPRPSYRKAALSIAATVLVGVFAIQLSNNFFSSSTEIDTDNLAHFDAYLDDETLEPWEVDTELLDDMEFYAWMATENIQETDA